MDYCISHKFTWSSVLLSTLNFALPIPAVNKINDLDYRLAKIIMNNFEFLIFKMQLTWFHFQHPLCAPLILTNIGGTILHADFGRDNHKEKEKEN